ncbi:MAG TPA: MBL fold metallo-hydrolase [Verrucomicrobiota bacterium]|nr:MBL fold metallo-hydrolase [Verrucomicrobiota bacterium]
MSNRSGVSQDIFETAMGFLDIECRAGGLWLPAQGLWLDPRRRRTGPEPVVVTHAHADHIGAHRQVILTRPTARFMRLRLGGRRAERIVAFGEPLTLEGPAGLYTLTLLPAGHILGSAMAFVQSDVGSLLYTGDFKLRAGGAAEPCDLSLVSSCDTLVMETTFGLPRYRFPPATAVWEAIHGFCRETLDQGGTPVLLAYSLGKSQEVLVGLGNAGFAVALDRDCHRIARLYEELGFPLPPYALWETSPAPGTVVVCAPNAARARRISPLTRPRLAAVTGWAMDTACRHRYGVDAAFPLSDHADFSELLELVDHVRPRRVWTLHGFAADFASTLRERGFDARTLGQPDQLSLGLPPAPT